MKAIILAAGRAQRFGETLSGRPKCLLEIDGETLLARSVRLLREGGIKEIILVRGYGREYLSVADVQVYDNDEWASSNMVYSLFCAERELDDDALIVYADIAWERRVLRAACQDLGASVGVIIDVAWDAYYAARYAEPMAEAESLVLDEHGGIIEIGEGHVDRSRIQGQYIGITRLTQQGCRALRGLYREWRAAGEAVPVCRTRTARTIYMTDALQGLIDSGCDVCAIPVSGGWLEFDTPEDYQKVLAWGRAGTLAQFFKPRE